MELAAIFIAMANFILYVSYIWGRYGVQESISISYYDLPVGSRIYFRLFIFILSACISFCGAMIWNEFLFFSGVLLSLVGLFSKIEDKKKKRWHVFGAISGIVLCYAGIAYEDIIIASASLAISLSILSTTAIFGKEKNVIWNIEVSAFIGLITGLFIIFY